MKIWKFRVIAPENDKTIWLEQEAEHDWQAIQEWHYNNTIGIGLRRSTPGETEIFARFEFEDGRTLVSRIFKSGIYRKGGVLPPGSGDSLEEKIGRIARTLGVSVETLAPANWVGEEKEWK